jgi:serine/threonine protein kinase
MAAESQDGSGGISSYTAGVLSKHAVRLDQRETNIPYDLITFLSAAQWRGVDFLPITWHPGLDTARGFTARVHQSLITTSFTFGFKRYRFLKREEEISNTYKALISEMCILGHPVIRQHNHILRLEGACWDPFTAPDDIFPVLVFERTRHGNLADFMLSDQGRSLSMHDRLVLCTHLIQAIETLHSCSKIPRLIEISSCHTNIFV